MVANKLEASKPFATLVTKLSLTVGANHVVAPFGALYVNFTFGTQLSVLLAEVDLFGPVLEHAVAFPKLVASDCVVPRRVTLETPD